MNSVLTDSGIGYTVEGWWSNSASGGNWGVKDMKSCLSSA